MASPVRILSIAPYCILPANQGGRMAIAKLHHHLGLQVKDDVISTADNGDNPYAFTLHRFFPAKVMRYLPGYALLKLQEKAKELQATHIICEHPYMALTAMALAKKLGVPWYMRSHNIESERFRMLGKKWWPVLKKFERFAMQQAKGVFFITPEDAAYGINNFGLPAEKCHFIPFGTDLQQPPTGKAEAKKLVAKQTGIDSSVPWLYFLGALDYAPNEDAVRFIVEEIHPRLQQAGEKFKILIAGKGLDDGLQQVIENTEHIHYTGFLSDLELFLKACDVMLNPVIKGGGIKTKAVEALGYNNTVVSVTSGAAGLLSEVCGEKLYISADNDWELFTQFVITAMGKTTDTPPSFYDTYYHGRIAAKVVSILTGTKD